jgi:hypothetical protein
LHQRTKCFQAFGICFWSGKLGKLWEYRIAELSLLSAVVGSDNRKFIGLSDAMIFFPGHFIRQSDKFDKGLQI